MKWRNKLEVPISSKAKRPSKIVRAEVKLIADGIEIKAPMQNELDASDHRHQCVTMQALPRSSFEVIEAEFFLQLRGQIGTSGNLLLNTDHQDGL